MIWPVTVALGNAADLAMANAVRIKFLRGIEEEVNAYPYELRMPVEEDRQCNNYRDCDDLNGHDRPIGTEHEVEGQQYPGEGSNAQINDVRAEHIPIFGFENGTAARALPLESEPILEDTPAAAKWTAANKRTNHPRSSTGRAVCAWVRYVRECGCHWIS